MDISGSTGELIGLALALLVAGAISGLIAGLFGVGGGTVLVPVLYQALGLFGLDGDVATRVAVATSVGIIVPTAFRSFAAHYARGAVDMDLLKSWLIAVPAGAVLATIVSAYLPGTVLRAIFAVIVSVFALNLIFGKKDRRLAADIPGNPVRAVVGAIIGFFATLLGVGGGLMNNTFMTLYGRTMHQAVATSAGVGALVSIPGLLGYIVAGWGKPGLPLLSLGYVNLLGVLLVTPVTMLTAPLGVRVAHALTRRQLELGFGWFLIVIAIRFIVSVFWG